MEIVNPIQTPFANIVAEREGIVPSSEDTGVVNWLHGFPSDFSKSTGDGGKFVKRKTLNYILWYISAAIKYFQKGGMALYNTAFSDGTYDKDSVLWFKRGSKYVLVQAVRDTSTAPTNDDLNKSENDQTKNWRMYKLLGYDGTMLTIDETFTAKENVTLEKNLSVNGNFQLGSGSRASGCPTPNNPNDFANKQYVDNSVEYKRPLLSSSNTQSHKVVTIIPTQLNVYYTHTVASENNGKLMIVRITDGGTKGGDTYKMEVNICGTWVEVGAVRNDGISFAMSFSCYCATGLQIRFKWNDALTYAKADIYFVG